MPSLTVARPPRTTSAIIAFIAAAAVLLAVPAPGIAADLCDGQAVTVAGATSGDDVLNGTSGPDVINGLGGNDTINGLGGDDLICGGDGDDVIFGGWGADDINGDGGADTIHGEGGADDIDGGSGGDTIEGGPGGDLIRGAGGDDIINGGDGNDDLRGGFGADDIDGGGGNDDIQGSTSDDTLLGGAGNDVLDGGDGNDTLKGQAGDDELIGGSDDDDLRGGNGDDDLLGGSGDDDLFGSHGEDGLRGGSGNDALFGGNDNDVLSGQGGVDTANGGDGDDDCAAETETACEDGLIDFEFDRFYINQAVPAADSDDAPADQIEPVVGRGGIVRAFFSANRLDNDYKPTVKLHWKTGGMTGEIVLDGPAALRKWPKDSNLANTHNYVFDDTFLQAGMRFYVEVDGDNEYIESVENNNRYPSSGWFDPGVMAVQTLEITFVPIGFDGGSAPTVTQQSALALLEDTIDVHPIADVDIEIHSAINYNTTGTFQDWTNMLAQVRDLAWAEESDRAYAGIVSSDPSGSGVGGIGYVNCDQCSVWPYSVSRPISSTIAHELGHNFGRQHVLCSGGEGNPDGNYPYAGGSIGSWGYEIDTGQLRDPAVFNDLMTYCSNEWVSDYTFGAVLDFRTSQVGFAMLDLPAGSSSVSFSGVLQGHDAASFRLPGVGDLLASFDLAGGTSTLRVPTGGDHEVVGRDAAGDVVVSMAFPVYLVADTQHLNEVRHFAFDLPVTDGDLAKITTWEIYDVVGLVATRPAG